MRDQQIRAALDQHWAASDANDFETEHRIYHEDAVLEYPQSGERIRGRLNIQITRSIQPNKKRFTVQRIIGGGELWITEFILSYDGKPSYTVSIMEFRGDAGCARNAVLCGSIRGQPSSRSICGTDGHAIWKRGDSLITLVVCDNLAAMPYREEQDTCGLQVNCREQAIPYSI